jgi:hypothetical protein
MIAMEKKTKSKSEDVMLLHSPTEDGEGLRAIRSHEGQLDFAEIRPAVEGQDISQTELVKLNPRAEMPLLCDVDVLYSPEDSGAGKETKNRSNNGPAVVATDLYRKNWDRIFKSRRPKSAKDYSLN